MSRFFLAVSATLTAFAFLGSVADAKPPTSEHAKQYEQAYHAVASQFGRRTPGRNIMRDGFNNQRAATDADVVNSLGVLQRMLAPPPPPTPVQTDYSSSSTPSGSVSSGGGFADVPGVPSSYAACVATRESSNGQGSSNIYGILGGGGDGSLAQQKAAFSQMYAAHGTQPWSPYDGC